ncbi:Hypothetical predicted protein [Paramuricea clavata]|uniref:Uncharacterized protein n=1 Tax=Paramuricea clavata TaxID=317549 RepID=A0A7D9K5N7_PARCT|nr:Hypothetical predicted protein [Paramuricea clavata]
MEDVARQKKTSVRSDISKISSATSKLHEAKLAATKASLIKRQTESRKKRALQLELAKMDMEIKRKEFEYNQRPELAHIEMESEVVTARDNTELAELEARIAEQEVSELAKHKEKDKESNRTCSTPLISSSSNSYQERNSTHPATADHIPPTGQSNVPKETSPLRDNPNANRATSILHGGQEDNFAVFRQRFEQLVQSKPLDKSTKMSCLLQLLDGAPLNAVKRYKMIPGGLTQAMKLLEDRFGRPCQIVRACVDSLTKGPMIAPNDKQGLRKYADDAQVMYDTLNSMNCLGEMNADNLEKMTLRLPSNRDEKVFGGGQRHSSERRTILTARSNNRDDVSKEQLCPMCNNLHPLYRCEVFKSKSPEERGEFVKHNRICFNCINSKEHIS